MVQVQVEFIELSHELLSDLLYMRTPTDNATALRTEVQELVRAGRATVVETMVCSALPGRNAVAESVREHLYPTEYELPGLPNEIKVAFGERGDDWAKVLSQLMTPPTPTAFETRHAGSTFGFIPDLSADQRWIDLRVAPELVALTGKSTWQRTKDSLGNENRIEMPLFFTNRLSTSVTAHDNWYVFGGVLSPRGDDGEVDFSRKLMVFLKCDVVAVGE
jgi:hypothetical protein